MDATDIQILGLLQEDDSRPLIAVAKMTGLSRTGCWHRIRRMEDEKLIMRRVALLDPERLGSGTTAFVTLKTNDKSAEAFEPLRAAILKMPQAVELHRVTGGDYLLKLRLASVAAYDDIYKKLIQLAPISDIAATFAMETLKSTTAVPLAEQGS